MVSVKIQCTCGQRYAFDVEPIFGQMPSAVACPGCGADGTPAANAYIAQNNLAPTALAAAPVAAAPARIAVSLPPVAAPAPGPALASHAAFTHGAQLDPVQARHEANAKILWGDAPEEVIKYLIIKGFQPDQADRLVQGMMKERMSTIRRNGIGKMLTGAGLVCVPIVAFFIFSGMGYIPLKVFAVTIMVGLFGGWMILKGVFMLSAPKSESGDVSEQ